MRELQTVYVPKGVLAEYFASNASTPERFFERKGYPSLITACKVARHNNRGALRLAEGPEPRMGEVPPAAMVTIGVPRVGDMPPIAIRNPAK